jgi:hypothetical protein
LGISPAKELDIPIVREADGYASLCFVVKNFLSEMIELERHLEILKCELAKKKDFTVTAAFQRFSTNMQSKLAE